MDVRSNSDLRTQSSRPCRARVGIADSIAFLTAWVVWMLASLSLGSRLLEIPSHGLPVLAIAAALVWLAIALRTGWALYAHVGPWRFVPIAAAVAVFGALILAQAPSATAASPVHMVVVHAPSAPVAHGTTIE